MMAAGNHDKWRSKMKVRHLTWPRFGAFAAGSLLAAAAVISPAQAQQKRPNIVMLMTDDTGWNDFGAYSGGGAALGHPTPNIDRIAKEGAVFTNWYGQASCTAGRASFITGRMPIRSALSIVVAPGDENRLRKQTPTIAEFFQKNGYTTYFSGKWHLGDKPDAYPTEHGFNEMKHFAAYYAGVYSYNDTSKWFHPWFPSYNPEYNKMYDAIVNVGEWKGVAAKPAKMVGTISYDAFATFDIRQTDSAVGYIKQHAKSNKPFFMDVNFIKMHNPTNAAASTMVDDGNWAPGRHGLACGPLGGPWRCNKQRASAVRRSNQLLWRSGAIDDREEHDLRGRNHRTATVPELPNVPSWRVSPSIVPSRESQKTNKNNDIQRFGVSSMHRCCAFLQRDFFTDILEFCTGSPAGFRDRGMEQPGTQELNCA